MSYIVCEIVRQKDIDIVLIIFIDYRSQDVVKI